MLKQIVFKKSYINDVLKEKRAEQIFFMVLRPNLFNFSLCTFAFSNNIALAKHTLEVSYDYDFLLIGISSHEKDYRICWALNKKLSLDLKKTDSLEIKGKKQTTPSYFSFFIFDKEEDFLEYSVIANFSESKSMDIKTHSLFGMEDANEHHSENELLIPEQKQMNYFLVVRGEMEDDAVDELVKQIKEIDVVQTAVRIDATQLKSKQNLIF